MMIETITLDIGGAMPTTFNVPDASGLAPLALPESFFDGGNPHHHHPSFDAVRRFEAAGGLFTIATGRTIQSAGRYPEMLGLKTTDGDALAQDSAYITEGMADTLGVEKGDRFRLFPSMSAQEYEFEIAGIVLSSMPQSLYIGAQCWTAAGAQFRPTNLLCGDVDTAALLGDGRITQITDSEQLEGNLTRFQSKFTGVFTLMKVVAFALVVIVLYNLSTLSFLERTKQYNTFRVLGFHFGEIRRLASFENIIILLFGTLVGIPFGYKFLAVYCATFSNDTMVFYPILKGLSLVITCVIVFVYYGLSKFGVDTQTLLASAKGRRKAF